MRTDELALLFVGLLVSGDCSGVFQTAEKVGQNQVKKTGGISTNTLT